MGLFTSAKLKMKVCNNNLHEDLQEDGGWADCWQTASEVCGAKLAFGGWVVGGGWGPPVPQSRGIPEPEPSCSQQHGAEDGDWWATGVRMMMMIIPGPGWSHYRCRYVHVDVTDHAGPADGCHQASSASNTHRNTQTRAAIVINSSLRNI